MRLPTHSEKNCSILEFLIEIAAIAFLCVWSIRVRALAFCIIKCVRFRFFFRIFISILTEQFDAETVSIHWNALGVAWRELNFPLLLIVIISIMFYVCFPCTMNFIKMMINFIEHKIYLPNYYGKLLPIRRNARWIASNLQFQHEPLHFPVVCRPFGWEFHQNYTITCVLSSRQPTKSTINKRTPHK